MNDETKQAEAEKRKSDFMKEIDNSFDKLEDYIVASHETKLREWVKGFGVGYVSAIVGMGIAGYIIVKLNDKK